MTIFKRRKHRDVPPPTPPLTLKEEEAIRRETQKAEAPGGCETGKHIQVGVPPPQIEADLALIEKLEKLQFIKRDASRQLLDEAIELQQAINLMRRAVRMAEKR